jgi:2-polyprenyl-3-methyl-5-hydroxy-6-metoxy-1,4-benzoquinol methylase
VRSVLSRLPRIHRAYYQTRYLLQIGREVFLTNAAAMNDRSHLEHEWNFGAGPDKDRWQRVVALVIEHLGQHWGEVLEIGCAEGLITAEIAEYASSLVAGDISKVARERTAARLSHAAHVEVISLDLQKDPLGLYDVVFAMDVLEFMHGRSCVNRTVDKLVGALRPEGLLVVSMCRYAADIRDAWWQRWVPEGADRVLPLIARHAELDQIHCEPHPADGKPIPGYLDHFIALFRRK